jgi:hypothetical protein
MVKNFPERQSAKTRIRPYFLKCTDEEDIIPPKKKKKKFHSS